MLKKEIEEAKKLFAFNYELLNSKSSPDGFLIKIKGYKKNDKNYIYSKSKGRSWKNNNNNQPINLTSSN